MTTRTEYDAKLDATERIERQVRRYDGAPAANLIVYGGVPIKDLAWMEMEPEEIASAAMGGVTEGEEFREGIPTKAMRSHCLEWEVMAPFVVTFVYVVRFSSDVYSVANWPDKMQREPIVEHDWSMHKFRPLWTTWAAVESLAGGGLANV